MRLALAGVLFASSLLGFSQISIAPKPLEMQLADADVVCVGSVKQSGSQALTRASQAYSRQYTITAVRLYKSAQSGALIDVSAEAGEAPLLIGARFVVFLSHQAHTSKLSILSALAVPDDFPLEQDLINHSSLENDIGAYLTSQSQKADTVNVEAMIKLLGQYQTLSSVSENILMSFTESAAPRAALSSTSILLHKHVDETRLAPLYFARLEEVSPSQYPDMGDISSIFIDNAQRAESGDFEKLASSKDLAVQHAALYALRKLADLGTTSFLIKELDVADSYSQYLALITLAEMYHKSGDYGPGLGAFQQDKEKYIGLWKKLLQAQTAS